MKTIYILNIPNFYSSYYIYGFSKLYSVKFEMDDSLTKYNKQPILIFKIDNKLGVINNDDPSYFDQNLYDIADISFFTNKQLDLESCQQKKVKSLFPHYPINILSLYLRLFNFNLIKFLKLKVVFKEIYFLLKRPVYKEYKSKIEKEDYVFFSSNIWKKEKETNNIRAEFIRYCKADRRITFEGGFVSRSDGNNFNFEEEIINKKKYSPKLFSKLSKKSKIVLNNPAVCGAVSWRLAEYLNQGLFILSFPFKIELPIPLEHEKEIFVIADSNEYANVFDIVLNNPSYHNSISSNGRKYFLKYCTPNAQVVYIVKTLLESN